MTKAETTDHIAALIRGIYDAFARHQSQEIDTVFHDDATIWDVFTPQLIKGTKERDAFHAADQAQMQARGPLTMIIDPPLVDVWDDTAIARYTLAYRYAPPNATAGHIRITDVLRRIEGAWKIVHHHEGAVPTGVPPITE